MSASRALADASDDRSGAPSVRTPDAVAAAESGAARQLTPAKS